MHLTLFAIAIMTALFYSIAERHARNFSRKRVGGLTFVRLGRLSFSYSIRRI